MIDFARIRELSAKIDEYAPYDGTEYGEASVLLVQLSQYATYLSEELLDAIVKEMEDHLDNYQTYATIVVNEEVVKRKVISLEWE